MPGFQNIIGFLVLDAISYLIHVITDEIIPFFVNSLYRNPIGFLEVILVILAVLIPLPERVGNKSKLALSIVLIVMFNYVGVAIIVLRLILKLFRVVLSGSFVFKEL